MNNYVYTTVVTTKDYLRGAQFLHHSLKKANSQYPLIIMVTDNLKDQINLQDNEYHYKLIPYYAFINNETRYQDTINKFQAFDLIEYDKVLFLDADIFIIRNSDYLFDELKDFVFWCGIRDSNTFCGDKILFTPQENIFPLFLQHSELMSSQHDEDFLLKLFPNYINNHSKDFSFSNYMYHDSGEKKYYTYYDFDVTYFNSFTDDEIFSFFQKWKHIKYPDIKQQDILNRFHQHELWLKGEPNGMRGDFENEDFSGLTLFSYNLSQANLTNVNFTNANLNGINFHNADLKNANFSHANINRCSFRRCFLRNANFYNTILQDVDFYEANLLNAQNLDTIKYDLNTTYLFAAQHPIVGDFIAFKKVRDYIVKLQIPEDAIVLSSTSRKCRASKAIVLDILTSDGVSSGLQEIKSNFDRSFFYRIGETLEIDTFDKNRWANSTNGIHFFLDIEDCLHYKNKDPFSKKDFNLKNTKSYAYVTLVTQLEFLKGAQALHYSLKKVDSQYPLIIMITDNLKDDIDFNEEFNYKIIPYHKFVMKHSDFQDTINKFQVFDLIEYDKVLFLDADVLVLENIDYLFDELKNVEFFAQFDVENERYGGGTVLFTPEKNKFDKFIQEYDTNEISTDEFALKIYFYPNYQGHQEIWDKLKFKIWHDGGRPKYWQSLPKDINLQTLIFNYLNEYIDYWKKVKHIACNT